MYYLPYTRGRRRWCRKLVNNKLKLVYKGVKSEHLLGMNESDVILLWSCVIDNRDRAFSSVVKNLIFVGQCFKVFFTTDFLPYVRDIVTCPLM